MAHHDLPADDGTQTSLLGGIAATLVVGVALFDPWGWAAFGPMKWALVTTLTLLMLAALSRLRLRIHRSSALAWLAFLGWGALAAVLALDPLHAWIGTPDRHLGWLAWVLFAIAFVAGQNVVAERGVGTVLRGATIAGLVIGGYAILEVVGLEPVELAIPSGRLGGSFGSAAYLGAAAALLLPTAIGAAVDRTETAGWRLAAGGAAALLTIAVLGSQTRAAWVGLAVAGIVTAPRWYPHLRSRRPLGLSLVAVTAVVLVATPVGNRAASTLDWEDAGTRGRIDEWQVGAAALASHPFVGVGPEGYRIVFPTEVDADYERRYTRQVMPDRAHNGALDVGLTVGFPGLLAYVAAALWLVGRALRGIRCGAPQIVGLSTGIVAYLVQQQFLFPLAEIDPVFWLFAGMVVAFTVRQEHTLRLRLPRLVAVAAGGLAVAAFVVGMLDVAADHKVKAALNASATGRHLEALELADAARRLRPDSIRYGLVAATVAAQSGDVAGTGAAVDRIEVTLNRAPGDPILRATQARMLLDLARMTGSPNDLTTALAAWADLVTDDPNNAQHHLQYGLALTLSGDVSGAAQAWLLAENLAPASPVPATNLAILYLDTGRLDEASAALNRAAAIEPGNPTVLELQRRLAAARP